MKDGTCRDAKAGTGGGISGSLLTGQIPSIVLWASLKQPVLRKDLNSPLFPHSKV